GVTEAEAPIGQRVMIHHYSGCGACKYCKVGYAQLCVKGGHKVYGSTADGGHAPYIKVLPYMLVPLDDALSFAEGASISCGTGTAYDALKRLNVSGRDTLAVYGQGPVGLSATMLGVAMGARVIAIDPSEARRQMATEFGADLVIDPAAGDPVAQVKEATHGEGASTTLDATGIPEPRQNTIKSASMWGRACLVGEGGDTTFSVSADIIHKQLTIHGSWTFSSIGQAECARFVLDHKLPLSRLLTHEFSLDQAEAAYKLFDTQTTGKGVFVRN
ncbi:MAG: zinc-binding dehydrogenase, partial [Dehalococcoidia bacterium]